MTARPAPWLDLAKAEIGTREIVGAVHNDRVVGYFAEVGHPEVKDDETAWCAAFVGAMMKRAGYPHTGLLTARSYANYGVPANGPEPGCIVVMKRNNSTWQGHVGFVVKAYGGTIEVLGGNQSNSVNVTPYPSIDVLAYRWPIAPTVAALRQAGSTEIKVSDRVEQAVIGTGVATGTAAVAQQATAPAALPVSEVAPAIPPVPVEFNMVGDYVSTAQQMSMALKFVLELVHTYWWAGVLLGCLAGWLGARWWKRNRVQRAEAGMPLSQQIGGAINGAT
jgi:uncharacterized protein (TIGR02594 family)